MRGGAFFNGKEGRVDFRKNLRFKEGRVGFRKASFIKKEKIIYNVRCEHYKLFFLQHQCHTLNTGSLSASAG